MKKYFMLLAVAGLISVTIVSCGEEEKKEPKGTNELTQKPKEENEPMTLIPDVNFENVLIQLNYDYNQDGKVATSSIASLTSLNISSKEISDLTGIEDFKGLLKLRCSNNTLKNINLSGNPSLEELDCSRNEISELDLSLNLNLIKLKCSKGIIESMNVKKNNLLQELDCSSNQISDLNLTDNVALESLNCSNNNLNSLNVSANINLKDMSCGNNNISDLDISKNSALEFLNCFPNPGNWCVYWSSEVQKKASKK
jgi:trimeric autotransporter adhesin